MVVLNAELGPDFREGGTEILLKHTGQPLDTREYVPQLGAYTLIEPTHD